MLLTFLLPKRIFFNVPHTPFGIFCVKFLNYTSKNKSVGTLRRRPSSRLSSLSPDDRGAHLCISPILVWLGEYVVRRYAVETTAIFQAEIDIVSAAFVSGPRIRLANWY